jgi:acyl-CoA synthetase (AMP-forming)/AMP-acid ligase II
VVLAKTFRSPWRTIPERVRQLAEIGPGNEFCTFVSRGEEVAISFGELYRHSRAYAATYAALGIEPGDIVIVMLEHSRHLFSSYLGAMLAGAIPAFMPFPSPKQRADLFWADHQALFARIEPRLLVTYTPNDITARAALGSALPVLIAGDEIFAAGESATALPGFTRLTGDIACLQHSSGTTALKKGVPLTHAAIAGHLDAYARAIELRPGDRIVSWLPLYHDMGFVACFLTALLTGIPLVALDPFEWVMKPHILFDAIERHRGTLCWLPNFAFAHLANAVRPNRHWDLSSMRAYINCSEPCKPATFERFRSRFAPDGVRSEQLAVCYAMAENVFGVTQTAIGREPAVRQLAEADAPSRTLASCGRPLVGVTVEIRGPAGTPLADGIVGEIFVRGPFLFRGYDRLPAETEHKLHGEWYASGDLGFFSDGELYVTGRVDDMLILNGRNYYAHEIEAIVDSLEGLLPGRTIAIGIDDERSGATVVVILAECRSGAPVTRISQEANALVMNRLGLSIHALVPLAPGSLIKTTSGKLSRSKNRQLYVDGAL